MVSVTLATRDYDHVSPLATGDVTVEGVGLTLIRSFDALTRVAKDASLDGGEVSFSRYLHGLAAGDSSLVGLPAFVVRGSGLGDVTDLAGKRVGTNEWPATGNTWTRVVLR